MPGTYESIATTTLGSASNSVTFSTISGAYTDLILAIAYSQDSTTVLTGIRYRFNSDTGTNYSFTGIQDGSPALTFTSANTSATEVGYQAATGSSTIISHINNYSSANVNKSLISRHSNAASLVQMYAGLWRNTAAITSITIFCNAGSFASGSTFSLYGIKAA